MSQQVSAGASLIQKKRLANESKLLLAQPLGYITAYPDEKNPLIWYFLLVGQKGTQYYGGHYIGEIHHSVKYPAEPPDYYMRTPNGRYEINKKICLTNSSYHKGDWSSTWNILSILIAFYSIWLDDGEHGISHITRSAAERKTLALESIEYNRKNYPKVYEKFNFDTLTDDVDNAPKINNTPTNQSNNTTTTNQTTNQTVTEPVVQQTTTEQTFVQQTTTEQTVVQQTITEQPIIETNNTKVEIVQEIIHENVFTGALLSKFAEMDENIIKLNDKIKIQEDKISNIIKDIAKNK